MADIIPEGFSQITVPLLNSAMTRSAAVVFGVRNPEGVVDPDAIATSVQADFVSTLAPRFDNAVTIGPALATVGTSSGEGVAGSASSSSPGTRSMQSPPPNVAVLVQKRTQRGGRRGRGRMYLPWFVDETTVDEAGRINSTELTALQTSISNFRGLLEASDTGMVLLHSAGSTAPGTPNGVTNLRVDAVIATQRRRVVR